MPNEIRSSSSQREIRRVNRREKNVHPKDKNYSITGREASEARFEGMEREISKPFEVPLKLLSMEEVERFWQDEKNKKTKEREADLANRHNYKSRLNILWKRERLFVADEGELPGGSLTEDIDPDFFTMVSGRPIKEKKNTREYLKDIRECFLTRLKTGYCLDEILLADERHTNEKRRLDQVSRRFHSALRAFEAFLAEDHLSSRKLLSAAKEEEAESSKKLGRINGLKEELKNLQAEVLVVEEKWRNYRMFQKFLYMIAPSEWRKVHDPYFGTQDVGAIASDPCLFDSFRELPGDPKIDLEVKISKFKEETREARPPSLYFTDPQQLRTILADLERNNLRALAHSKELDFPVEKMAAEFEKLKRRFERDRSRVEEEIKFTREAVEAEERKWRASEEELRTIAFGLFRDLLTDEEYLSVAACVEDVYEDAVASDDGHLDLVAMMKEIESKHESLLLALDVLPNDVMVRTTRRFHGRQKRTLKEAEEAERKVHQMERLLKRLSKALAAPKKGAKERKMAARSLPPEEFTLEFEAPKVLSKEARDRQFFYGKVPENVRLHKPLWA